MSHTLPLNAQMLNRIRMNIKALAEGFEKTTFNINDLGHYPNNVVDRSLSEWPKEEALDFFVKENAIKRENSNFEIVNIDYFNIDFSKLELPIKFSVDERIKADLLMMSALQADMYEIENRLRYLLEDRLVTIFGSNFVSNLPPTVKNNITTGKNRPRWHMPETRTLELSYSNFSDLIEIIKMPELFRDNKVRSTLIDTLNYLAEARTRISHNNPIPPSENQKIQDYANNVRALLSQLTNA